MKRISLEERPDWRVTAEREGFDFHTIDGERYWDERHYYLFNEQQITRDLEAPTQALHQLCLDAVERVSTARRYCASWPFLKPSLT